MNDDPIVASVRAIRDELAAKFNYDVHAIFADMRTRDSQAGDRPIAQPARMSQAMCPNADSVSQSGQPAP